MKTFTCNFQYFYFSYSFDLNEKIPPKSQLFLKKLPNIIKSKWHKLNCSLLNISLLITIRSLTNMISIFRCKPNIFHCFHLAGVAYLILQIFLILDVLQIETSIETVRMSHILAFIVISKIILFRTIYLHDI